MSAFNVNLRRHTWGSTGQKKVVPITTQQLVLGKAVHVEPMEPMLKPPGTQRLKLKPDESFKGFAFDFNLRRYSWGRRPSRRPR